MVKTTGFGFEDASSSLTVRQSWFFFKCFTFFFVHVLRLRLFVFLSFQAGILYICIVFYFKLQFLFSFLAWILLCNSYCVICDRHADARHSFGVFCCSLGIGFGLNFFLHSSA